MKLEELERGSRVSGVLPATAVAVIDVQWHGADTVELTFKSIAGDLGQRLLSRDDEPSLSATPVGGRPFTADAADFKLAAEAQRIQLAGLYDPMLAVATSDVRPLPHQIRAVYGELLPRTPLRFLLADDPGAGKTIMAGLYIKELLLRDDVRRCLIVAPGGLVEQWQDELFSKFGLRFDILTRQLIEASLAGTVFDSHPLLIARMDQLARNEDLQAELERSDWDLVVVDEGTVLVSAELTEPKLLVGVRQEVTDGTGHPVTRSPAGSVTPSSPPMGRWNRPGSPPIWTA